VSYAVALLPKSEDAFAPLINSVILLPLNLWPGWLQGIARITRSRYIIDMMREWHKGH
jgi:hypothetical protein